MKRIIISRTDSIGDVVLTLPLASFLKQYYNKNCYIIFLGRSYTRSIIELYKDVDEFADYSIIENMGNNKALKTIQNLRADTIIHVFPRTAIAKIAKLAGIKERIGTSNRWYNWLYCNKLSFFSRRKSSLHEAQLNFKLLKPLGINTNLSLSNISLLYSFKMDDLQDLELVRLRDENKFNLIIHPKSKGSAREWSIDNYKKLIELLPKDKFKIFITGTADEGALCKELFKYTHVENLTGLFTLKQLIAFINIVDGLVACSTGPLHIAAVLNKIAIGIYPPIKPMHPERWRPIGQNAKVFVKNEECSKCKNKDVQCLCIESIKPEDIYDYLIKNIFCNS